MGTPLGKGGKDKYRAWSDECVRFAHATPTAAVRVLCCERSVRAEWKRMDGGVARENGAMMARCEV